MEEVEDDDFGDLYADVEVQVSCAFHAMSNLNNQQQQQYADEQDENKNERGEGGLRSDSNSKNGGEELFDSKESSGLEAAAAANNGGEKDLLILDNGSDSEDDLHIVLNEEDCRKYTVPYNNNNNNNNNNNKNGGGNMGIGHRRRTSDEGDDDDDLVIIAEEADGTSKDKKWVDKLLQHPSDGLEEQKNSVGTERRGGTTGVKCSYTPQYSQYKYIRTHASNAKTSGARGISFSFPLWGRGDWDVNGSNQIMGSSPGLTASSCTTFPVVSKNGCDFSLPRYRTILDLNIESFERKPWRQPGVDITDFFNFGFDEESWKHYCNLLEQFRLHSNMLGQFPIYEGPSKPQAYKASCCHDSVDPEVMETLKGRAIQVEGGIGERQPSMDIRRPRNRDSDVVIQISVQDSKHSSSSPIQEEPGFVDSSMLEASENEGSGLDVNGAGYAMEVVDGCCRVDESSAKNTGGCHLMRSSQRKRACTPLFLGLDGNGNERILDAEGCHLQKSRGEVEIVQGKEGDNESPDKSGPCILEAKSSLGVPIQCSPGLSCLNNRAEASKAGVCIHVEDTGKPAKRPSINSISGLRESFASDCNFKTSGSNANKQKWRKSEDEFGNQSTVQTEQYPCSRMKFRSVAELKIHADDESPISGERGRYVVDHLTEIHTTRKGRKRDYYFKDGEDLSYYKETEISIGCHSAQFIKKQLRNSSSGTFQRKGYPHLPTKVDPFLRRHRQCFQDKRINARDNEVMQREGYLCEKRHTNGSASGAIHEESTWSTFEYAPFYRDEERYRWQRRRSDDEYEFKKGREEDFVLDHSYKKEFYEENYGRDIPYRGRDYFQEKYESHGPYIEKELKRSNRRERYGDNLCFDFDNFRGHDDKWWRSPDHDSLPPYFDRESHTSYGRGYHDSISPETDLYDSWRSDERSVGHWHRIHTDKHRSSSWLDSSFKDHQNVDRTIYADDDSGNYRGRYNSPTNWAKDDFNFRHQDRGRQYDEEPFLYERNLRHESIHVKHDSDRSEMFLNESRSERDRNRILRVESRSSGDREDEEAALRCRDSVDLHLINWEGKRYAGFDGTTFEVQLPFPYGYINSLQSSGRHSKVGDARCSGRDNNMGYAFDEDWSFRYSDEPQSRTLAPPHFRKVESNCYREFNSKVEGVNQCHLEKYTDQNNEKFQGSYYKEVAVHEEKRQIGVEEPEKKDPFPPGKKWVSEELAWNGDVRENKMSSKVAVDETKVTKGFDNQRILDTLAKMEKRRQRFEKSTTSKTESDKNPIPPHDLVVEPVEGRQQRPARKRRWGGI